MGLLPTWARITRVTSAEAPRRLWHGTPHLWGWLKLGEGHYSFASPSGFIRHK
jgi:hypothetical protein